MPESLGALLKGGLGALDIKVTETFVESALHYIKLVDHWNQRINLTAVRHPEEMIVRHLLDSLSVSSFVDEQRVLDIGSGAGLPGIPLALLRPEQEWHLIDSSGKRISFLREVVRQLGLNNVQISQVRVEEFEPERRFPAVIARAFASLGEIADNASHLLLPEGTLWAMKGRFPHAELADLPAQFKLVKVHSLDVPGLLEDRHLVQLSFNPET